MTRSPAALTEPVVFPLVTKCKPLPCVILIVDHVIVNHVLLSATPTSLSQAYAYSARNKYGHRQHKHDALPPMRKHQRFSCFCTEFSLRTSNSTIFHPPSHNSTDLRGRHRQTIVWISMATSRDVAAMATSGDVAAMSTHAERYHVCVCTLAHNSILPTDTQFTLIFFPLVSRCNVLSYCQQLAQHMTNLNQ